MSVAPKVKVLGSVIAAAAALAGVFSVSVGAGGFRPRPLFATPGGAAYCYVDGTSQDDFSAQLFCWTPNDGWAVYIGWKALRAAQEYFTKPSAVVHALGNMKGCRPRAPPLLRFGQRWTLRCLDPGDYGACGRREGVVSFTCVSRRSGLTCTNAATHGFWIGRYRGYRLI